TDSRADGNPAEPEPGAAFDHRYGDRRSQEVDPEPDAHRSQLRRTSAAARVAEVHRGSALGSSDPGHHHHAASVHRGLPRWREAVLPSGGLERERGRAAVRELAASNQLSAVSLRAGGFLLVAACPMMETRQLLLIPA